MTTVFVYEDVTAGGAGGDHGSPPAPSLLAEGRAMRDAVAADFAAVPGVRVLMPGERRGVSPTCLPATGTSGLRLDARQDQFRDLAGRADFTLVIAPECGGRLEHLCREVLRAGGRLLGPSPDAVRLTADKLELARHWERAGVPTPATWEFGSEPDDVPVVVKPRDGAGSQATCLSVGTDHRLVSREVVRRAGPAEPEAGARATAAPPATAVALAPASGSAGPRDGCQEFRPADRGAVPTDSWPGPLLAQQYIPGLAASVAFLIGPADHIPLVPCEQLLSTDGRFQYLGGRLPIRPDLADRATRIATEAVRCVPGLLGNVGVDLVLGDDGRDWAIEINPRLTTSYVGLRALARFNLAAAMLAVVRGEPHVEMSWAPDRIEFCACRSITQTV